jgi:hypothetical protein
MTTIRQVVAVHFCGGGMRDPEGGKTSAPLGAFSLKDASDTVLSTAKQVERNAVLRQVGVIL